MRLRWRVLAIVGGVALMIAGSFTVFGAAEKNSVLGHAEQSCSASVDPGCFSRIQAEEDFWSRVEGVGLLAVLAGFTSALAGAVFHGKRANAAVLPRTPLKYCAVCGGPLVWMSESGRWYCGVCVEYR
jgi:hypothetical protein